MYSNFSNECIKPSIERLFKISKYLQGRCNKKKTDLLEMIIYGCITNKLNKKGIEDISANHATKILKRNVMSIK